MPQIMLACALSASTLMVGGCGVAGPQSEVIVLEVGPATAECVGEMVQRCLLVREPPAEEWTLFYDPIEGFEHEEGFTYQLEVERTHVPDPPADGSSYEYRLLRVLAKEPAGP